MVNVSGIPNIIRWATNWLWEILHSNPNQQSDENLCKMGFLNIWVHEEGGVRLKDKIANDVLSQFEFENLYKP